jgi:hypothetical protein
MMYDVNWWLMAIAFVLGLVLTLFSTIDRAHSEGPHEQLPAEDE